KYIVSFLLFVSNSLLGYSQGTLIDEQVAYGGLFCQSVKSCDEFMCRFNEEEFFPDLDASAPELGKKNFLFLFDYKLSEGKEKSTFLQDIFLFYSVVKTNKVKLDYDSRKWFAELRTEFTYKKKSVELGIILQTEKSQKGLPCWSIVGVNGLEKIGFRDTTNRYTISPEQHEALFSEIDSDLQYSSKEFSLFRGQEIKIDALSYFFCVSRNRSIKIPKKN
ncbi:MAG: hypothetical protein LUD00_08630, partial [Prevotellaceae bacterium]|nr:hypothetical protein [Prevotellaceae bacterium]